MCIAVAISLRGQTGSSPRKCPKVFMIVYLVPGLDRARAENYPKNIGAISLLLKLVNHTHEKDNLFQ